MSINALIVIGSRTNEDVYGVTSGNRVAAALQRQGWNVNVLHARNGRELLGRLVDDSLDLIVPVGYGPPCEDGHIFAAARLAGIPCAGPSPAAGSLMQDKHALSMMVDSLFPTKSGVRPPRGCAITENMSLSDVTKAVSKLTPPLLIKAGYSGSSEGMSVVDDHEEAISIARALLPTEGKVVVQKLEQSVAFEVSCTVLDTVDGPHFLPIVELRRDDVAVLSRNEKAGEDGLLDRHIVPARVSADVAAKIESAVLKTHQEIGPCGLTRTDVLGLTNGELVILEVNGIPGLMECSIAGDAATNAGMGFEDLAVNYALSAYLPRSEPRVWEIPTGVPRTVTKENLHYV